MTSSLAEKPGNGPLGQPKRLGLVGVGGVGNVHLGVLRGLTKSREARLVAVADPGLAGRNEAVADFAHEGITAFFSLEELLASGVGLDGVVLATPIPLHFPMTMACLQARLPVLMEKPPVVLPAELTALENADAEGVVAIGFQLAAASLVQEAKSLILSGTIGSVIGIRAMAGWPRDDAYYVRAGWAGRMNWRGLPTFDGPATNGLAHLVQLGMFLAGPTKMDSGVPETVTAELYRGRSIESYDAACLRCEFPGGIPFTVALAHCVSRLVPAEIQVLGTRGSLCIRSDSDGFLPMSLSVESRGDKKVFSVRDEDCFEELHRHFLGVLDGRLARQLTGLADCRGYVLATTGALLSSAGIRTIPAPFIRPAAGKDGAVHAVEGLESLLQNSFRTGCLFSELGAEWASPSHAIPTADITPEKLAAFFPVSDAKTPAVQTSEAN
jgi:predicted dehydrogenase